MKFARQETDEAKARRLRSFDYLQKKQEEESWVKMEFHGIDVSLRMKYIAYLQCYSELVFSYKAAGFISVYVK